MSFTQAFRTATLSALILALTTSLSAQDSTSNKDSRITALIDTLHKTRPPMQAAISPDATTVAWSVRTPQGTQLRLTDITKPWACTPTSTGGLECFP